MNLFLPTLVNDIYSFISQLDPKSLMAQILLSPFPISQRRRDSDLVSSKLIQTLAATFGFFNSFILNSRIGSTDDRIRWFWRTLGRVRQNVVVLIDDKLQWSTPNPF